ncbi:glycosyltransferase family 8 protein [Macellibacteroides fermentans]|uniref:Lipopolysaccharide biosynthesis protein, LPS:glycosyltransferase n=1 Tax=Parabacteroides chartae TaxID=1037355 RepID=A0A1T5AN19_9BACT|nr:glycosyltransferase family 8 protein [Parabacteroides chartae]SKB36421.1 Lipopolysaccharide biosynthesis protein, LPS:glycosyltransferase [Parabacteroides chartae]
MTKDIVLICDDNYVMPTQVCIQSIIENMDLDFELTIHVCTFSLSHNNVVRFHNMSRDKVNVLTHILNYEKYEDKIKQIAQKSHVSPSALIKFELSQIFNELDTILYLDSDIIVKKDITQLLSINLSDYYIAAAYEFWKYIENKMYHWGQNIGGFFFNSGVMLMNLSKIRQDNIREQLWYYKINLAKSTLMDQESLNYVFKKAVYPLSIVWNFNPAFRDNNYIKHINRIYNKDYSCLEELESRVRIIHYVGTDDKPWIYKTAKMRKYWDACYNMVQDIDPIIFKTTDFKRKSFFVTLKAKIEKYSLSELCSYIVYKLFN